MKRTYKLQNNLAKVFNNYRSGESEKEISEDLPRKWKVRRRKKEEIWEGCIICGHCAHKAYRNQERNK